MRKFQTYENARIYVNDEAAMARLVPAHRSDANSTTGYPQVENYRFVYNFTDGRVSDVVSEEYKLTNHPEFFNQAIDAARQIMPSPRKITIDDARERVDMEVVGQQLADPDEVGVGDDLAFGLRFSNSFDRSIRETVSPYALRLVCDNGMILKKTLGSTRRYHRGEYDTEELIGTCMDVLEQETTRVPKIVADAASRVVPDWRIRLDEERELIDQHEAELEMAGFGSTYVDEIGDEWGVQLRDGSDPTARTLYNACTSVIEHRHSDVQQSRRERLHVQAERILTGDAADLVEQGAVERIRA